MAAKGLSCVQQDGIWLLTGSKGSVPIPPGQEAVVSWIVARPGFTEGRLAEAFPDREPDSFGELLDGLIGMKVIAPK